MLHFTIDKKNTYGHSHYVEVKCNEIKSSKCIQQLMQCVQDDTVLSVMIQF